MAKTVIALYKVRSMEKAARRAGNDPLADMLKRERAAITSEIFFG